MSRKSSYKNRDKISAMMVSLELVYVGMGILVIVTMTISE
jgi:hypothetical protein